MPCKSIPWNLLPKSEIDYNSQIMSALFPLQSPPHVGNLMRISMCPVPNDIISSHSHICFFPIQILQGLFLRLFLILFECFLCTKVQENSYQVLHNIRGGSGFLMSTKSRQA